MSTQITTAFVQQYHANVFHTAQQKGSRLRMCVRNETQNSKSDFYDRIGPTAPVRRTSRHAPTPRIDSVHSRRRVTLNDYEWSDLIDKQDRLRMLLDPTSDYIKAASYSLGRGMDSEIISAALGNAYVGETGSSTTALGTGQRLVPILSSSITNMTVDALIAAKEILNASDVEEDEDLYIAVTAKMLTGLFQSTEVTSSDYNTVKALAQGKIDTFMGFKFIRTQLLPAPSVAFSYDTTTGLYNGSGTAVTLASCHSAIAWAKSGILLATGQDITARVSERDDLSYATQAYASMSVGAVRMEEAKVVEIICNG
jgi:hypothetical protein